MCQVGDFKDRLDAQHERIRAFCDELKFTELRRKAILIHSLEGF